MALRLLGRKLMIGKPQKLGFYFRNSYHTAVFHDNPGVQEEYHVDVLEENHRLKEENRQLIENRRLKEKNQQLIENRLLKEENRQLIERLKPVEEGLKPVEEEIVGDLQRDTQRDDISITINELFENVTRLEQKILGDLHHDIENERDRCKSLETKLEKALQKIEEMNKEITKLKNASNMMDGLNERMRRLEMKRMKKLVPLEYLKSADY